jgi:DNA repair exonuclease SbcCD ATPase subunit
MKLTLTNFRCYTKQTFEFDEKTTTLITGPSGHGKTTILLAIQFVLYGSTNQKFLVSYNKTSCEVVLEYTLRNIKFIIKRTKRPNILNLALNNNSIKSNYEDKEAQVVINRYFGNRYATSFLDLSQLDKLQFLQEIANSDCDVQTLKSRIKTEIGSLNTELATLSGQISSSESILALWQKPRVVTPPIPRPFNTQIEDPAVLSAMKMDLLEKLSNMRKRADLFHSLSGQAQALRQTAFGGLDDDPEKLQRRSATLLEELDAVEERRTVLERLRKSHFAVEECVQQLKLCEDVSSTDIVLLEREIVNADSAVANAQRLEEVRRFREVEAEYLEALAAETSEHLNACDTIERELVGLPEPRGSFKDIQETLFRLGEARAFNSRHLLESVVEEIENLKRQFFKHFHCFNCNHPFTINMDTFEMSDDNPPVPSTEEVSKQLPKEQQCGTPSLRDVQPKQAQPKQAQPKQAQPKQAQPKEAQPKEAQPKEAQPKEAQPKEACERVKQLKKLEWIKEQIVLNNVTISNTDKKSLERELRSCELRLKLVGLGEFVQSKHLVKLSKKVKKLRPKVVTSDVEEDVWLDVDKVKDAKRDLEIRLNCKRNQLLRRQTLLAKIDKREPYDELEHEEVNKRFMEVSIDVESLNRKARVREELAKLEQKLIELQYEDDELEKLGQEQSEIDSRLEYLERLREYEAYQAQLEKYATLEHDLLQLHNYKKGVERRYLKTLLFRQKVIEAEHESLQQTLDMVNAHLDMLLQDFFSESFGDPIQIYLDLVNDNKRPRVDTVINYKGNKIDYKSLSTGEYTRVKLAFDLAFKEILDEHIVMLDECTANLDHDLSTKIFAKIQSTFTSKTILVVAHQVVTGAFDHIIKV